MSPRPRSVSREEFERGVRAMTGSRAWPAVFRAGSARTLLSAALAAMGITERGE